MTAATPGFIGDTAGTWSERNYNEYFSLDLIPFEDAKPARTDDFNQMQQDAQAKRRDFSRHLVTDGWSVLGAFSFPGTATNTFLMGESWYNEYGHEVHIGNPDAAANNATIALAPPPSSGTAVDLAFLEMWVEEVAAPGSTDNSGGPVSRSLFKWGGVANNTFTNLLWWSALSVEPSRRLQLRWAIRSVRGATTMVGVAAQGSGSGPSSYTYALMTSPTDSPTNLYIAGDGTSTTTAATRGVSGYIFATPIALIQRQAGLSTILSGAVTDLRNPEQLQPGVKVPIGNVTPNPAGDPTLLHLAFTHFVYQGTSLASYTPVLTPGGSSTTVLLSGSWRAVKLTLPSTLVSLPYDSTGSSLITESGNFTVVTRATINAAIVGAGSPVTVYVMADNGGVPDHTRIYSQFTLPVSFLTSVYRDISVPVFNCAVSPSTPLWVVVGSTGTTGNTVSITQALNPDTNHPGATSADGVTWTPGASPLSAALYGGDTGLVVLVVEGGVETTLIEYGQNGSPSAIGEAYQPAPNSGLTPFNVYRQIYYGQSGNILDIS